MSEKWNPGKARGGGYSKDGACSLPTRNKNTGSHCCTKNNPFSWNNFAFRESVSKGVKHLSGLPDGNCLELAKSGVKSNNKSSPPVPLLTVVFGISLKPSREARLVLLIGVLEVNTAGTMGQGDDGHLGRGGGTGRRGWWHPRVESVAHSKGSQQGDRSHCVGGTGGVLGGGMALSSSFKLLSPGTIGAPFGVDISKREREVTGCPWNDISWNDISWSVTSNSYRLAGLTLHFSRARFIWSISPGETSVYFVRRIIFLRIVDSLLS